MTQRRRPIPEPLEGRILLSAYAANPIGRFGVNDTGFAPNSITMDGAGNIYGIAGSGGAYGNGTIFEFAKGSGTITPLASFHGSSVSLSPDPLAIDADGNLYGATFDGGTAGLGTIFEVVKGSGAITTLYSFGGAITAPMGNVVLDAAGDIFGATEIGGPVNHGVVFELAKGSQSLTVLASATSATGYLLGSLVPDGAGDLFGAANDAIFEIVKGSGQITTLATFAAGSQVPGLAVDANLNVYGDFAGTSSAPDGSIFEIPAGGTLTALATFSNASGIDPGPVTMDANGDLYGSTSEGGINQQGTVFELAKGSGTITSLASFTFNTGYGGHNVAVDGSGNIFGITATGGSAFDGSVFELASGGGTIQTVVSFDGNNGVQPNSNFILDGNGDLFGMTASGGAYGDGSVFEIAVGSDTVTTLASFDGSNGRSPTGSLAMDSRGNLYGATSFGGAYGSGTIFELQRGGASIEDLVSFTSFAGSCASGVVSDGNGDIYGTLGGAQWSIFEIPNGSTTLSTLASSNSISGSDPSGPLAIDSMGDLFGMTSSGGANGYGTVFELPTDGATVTVLGSFSSSTEGAHGGVTVDATGNVYGTLPQGGPYNAGAVFEVVKGSGTVSTLASFDIFGTGSDPVGNLIVDSNGDVFGVAQDGGIYEYGSVFEIVKGSGTIDNFFAFDGLNGNLPFSLATDGRGDFFCATEGEVREMVELTPAAGAVTLRQDVDQKQIDWTIGTNSGKTLIDDPLGLSLAGDGNNDTITLDYSNGGPLPNTLHLSGTFTINGLSGSNPLAGTTLDIGKSTVFVSYSSSDPIASIKSYLQAGYNQGSWNATPSTNAGVITSLAGAGNPNQNTAIGYADSADGQGVNTNANTIELKYTLVGDANLDGQVNSADLQIVLAGLNRPGAWDQGDFNYDGQANSADLQSLLFTLNTSLGSQATPMAIAATTAGAMPSTTSASTTDSSTKLVPVIHSAGSVRQASRPAQQSKVSARKRR